jgi:hypothetical protein
MRFPIRLAMLACLLTMAPACHKETFPEITVDSKDPVVREAFSPAAMAG